MYCITVQGNKSKKLLDNKQDSLKPSKQAKISKIPPLISLRLSKSVLAKSKFFKKNQATSLLIQPTYAQASSRNINDKIKIKDSFLKLFTNKVSEIHNVINKMGQKYKPKLIITTKKPSRKQIIIFMSSNSTERIMAKTNITVVNINWLLKGVKSEVSVDFI